MLSATQRQRMKKKKKRTNKVNNPIRLEHWRLFARVRRDFFSPKLRIVSAGFVQLFFFRAYCAVASIAHCQRKKKYYILSATTFETSGGTHVCIQMNYAENFMRANNTRPNRLFVKLKQSFIPAAPSGLFLSSLVLLEFADQVNMKLNERSSSSNVCVFFSISLRAPPLRSFLRINSQVLGVLF